MASVTFLAPDTDAFVASVAPTPSPEFERHDRSHREPADHRQ